MSTTPDPDFARKVCERFLGVIPHVQAMGIELGRVEASVVHLRLPIRPEFLGDSERGIVHTGIVSSLIDSACGLAVLLRIGRRDAIATLDLRVDYLRPTVLGTALQCRAECYRLTEQIAFANATVWQHDEAEPVATSLSAFMRGGSPGRSFT